jgi:hypothetical protein
MAFAIAAPISAQAVIPCTKGWSCISQGMAAKAMRPRTSEGSSNV